MSSNTVEIMNRGMQCLTDNLGVIEAEHFISVIIREKFDYTKWQRDYFDKMEDFHKEAIEYAKSHPRSGKAQLI